MDLPRRIWIALGASLALHLAVINAATQLPLSHGRGLDLSDQGENQGDSKLVVNLTTGLSAVKTPIVSPLRQEPHPGVPLAKGSLEDHSAAPNPALTSGEALTDQRAKEAPKVIGLLVTEEAFFAPSDVQVPTHPLTPVNLEAFTEPPTTYVGQVIDLRIFTDEHGTVESVETLKESNASPEVELLLAEAVKSTPFAAAIRDGFPVASYVDVEISMDAMVSGIHLGK
jgi:hypothetical protein